jgi:hypothetical protein
MPLSVRTSTGSTYNPVFLKILEDIPGGVTVKTDEIPSDVKELKAGTLLAESSSTSGLFNVVKNAKSNGTQASSANITLTPGHLLKAGDFVAIDGKSTGTTISSITHTSTSTDTIVLASSMGTMATSSLVRQVSAASGTADKYDADSVLRDNVWLKDLDGSTLYNITAGAVVRGTIDTTASPYWYRSTDKTNLTAVFRFVS